MAELTDKIFIGSDTLFQITGLKDNDTGSYINNADSVKVSIFKPELGSITAGSAVALHKLSFTSGGVHVPTLGDTIVGVTSGATAVIEQIEVSSGTWAGGDAAGDLHISSQIGTFSAAEDMDGPQVAISSFEDAGGGEVQANCASAHGALTGDSVEITDTTNYNGTYTITKVDDTKFKFTKAWVVTETGNCHLDNFATITADSTKNQRTKIPATAHGLDSSDFIRIESTDQHNDQYDIEAIRDADNFIIDKTYVAETFDGDEGFYVGLPNGKDISLTYIPTSSGNYKGTIPDNIGGLFSTEKHFVFVEVVYGSVILLLRLEWQVIYQTKTG